MEMESAMKNEGVDFQVDLSRLHSLMQVVSALKTSTVILKAA